MKSHANGNSKPETKEPKVSTMRNEASQSMEVVMVPIIGKVVEDNLVEFDLEALYKAQPELALRLIQDMKGE